jgi:predicted MFS family arabinose efflux permease
VQVELRSGLGITAEEIAALVWAFSFSLASGALLAQVLIGHWERRAVLLASLTLLGCGGVALGLAQTWEQAMAELAGWRAARFVAGAAVFAAALSVATGVPGGVRGARTSFSAMLAVFADRATPLTIATTLLLICGGFITYAMVAVWFVEVGGAPRSALTMALLAAGIASVIGNAFSSHLVRLLGRDGTILGGIGFTAFCFLILWAAPSQYWASYPAFIFFGIGWARCLAPLQARLMETAGARAQLALALNASAFFGGQGLGAAGGGAVYETYGPSALPIASMAVLVLAALLFFISKQGGAASKAVTTDDG